MPSKVRVTLEFPEDGKIVEFHLEDFRWTHERNVEPVRDSEGKILELIPDTKTSLVISGKYTLENFRAVGCSDGLL